MQENVNVQIVRGNWWMGALRGVLSIIFGLIVLVYPAIALLAFIYVFAAYVLVDGIVAIATAIQERGVVSRWGWLLFEGILGIIAGILAFVAPILAAVFLLYVIASWAVVTGIVQIVAAFSIRGVAVAEWALGLAGLVSLVFGILLFINPGPGLLGLLWLIGIYAIVFGVLFIIRAFQWRSWGSAIEVKAG